VSINTIHFKSALHVYWTHHQWQRRRASHHESRHLPMPIRGRLRETNLLLQALPAVKPLSAKHFSAIADLQTNL